MKEFILSIVLCVGIPTGAGAQTFTQRLQKQPTAGQGSVTLHQSDSIDRLVNTTVLAPKSTTTTKTSTTTQPNAATQPSTASRPATQTERPQEIVPDTLPKMIRNGHKVMGYRVQAFAGGNSRKDRQQAEQVRNSIKSHYPNVPVYVHFYSPRWICRVGNYRTYEEAHQMLVSLRDLGFNQATIVKGKITVSY
jgi:hypothetical protein